MKTILLLALLLPGFAYADEMFKCVKDGRTTFQDSPCDDASKSTVFQKGSSGGMAGCYVIDFAGWESGRHPELMAVVAAGNGTYTLESGSGKEKVRIPMKRATPDELLAVGQGFHVRLKDGVSMKWDQGTPNQKPVGIYKGVDDSGKDILFGFFFLSNGLATKVVCPH